MAKIDSNLIAQAKLFSYCKPKLENLIDIRGTKMLLLLAIYDYLIGEISFSVFLFITNQLYSGINNPGDLSERDTALFSLLLDLDDLEEEISPREEKEWRKRLIAYYRANLPPELRLDFELIEKYKRKLKTFSFRKMEEIFVSKTRNCLKGEIPLMELDFWGKKLNRLEITERKKWKKFSSGEQQLLGISFELEEKVPWLFLGDLRETQTEIKELLQPLVNKNFTID